MGGNKTIREWLHPDLPVKCCSVSPMAHILMLPICQAGGTLCQSGTRQLTPLDELFNAALACFGGEPDVTILESY